MITECIYIQLQIPQSVPNKQTAARWHHCERIRMREWGPDTSGLVSEKLVNNNLMYGKHHIKTHSLWEKPDGTVQLWHTLLVRLPPTNLLLTHFLSVCVCVCVCERAVARMHTGVRHDCSHDDREIRLSGSHSSNNKILQSWIFDSWLIISCNLTLLERRTACWHSTWNSQWSESGRGLGKFGIGCRWVRLESFTSVSHHAP